MKEGRATYRTQPGPEGVTVAMTCSGHSGRVDVSIVNLSARGLAVAVPKSEMPPLSVGAGVDLRFQIQGLEPIAGILAVVRHQRESGEQRIIGLELLDWTVLHERLPPNLFSAFNRRLDPRTSLPEGAEAEVELVASGEPVSAALVDVSAGGCSLSFAPGQAPQGGDRIRIRFRLPETGHDFDLLASVKGATEENGRIRCSAEFDRIESRNFVSQGERISEYVAKRLEAAR